MFYSFLDELLETSRLAPAEVARLETELIRNPGDLFARARLLTHYFQYASRQRLDHILWVVKNRPESKLAGSPMVRILPGDDPLNTRSDYEAVRMVWVANVERHADNAAVLGNAALFFEAEEPVRAGDLFERSWRLDHENTMRRNALASFYARMLAACDAGQKTCPDPIWLMRAKSELGSL